MEIEPTPLAVAVADRTRIADAPYVDAQNELELMFDKNQRSKRIKAEFDIPKFHDMCQQAAMPVEFCLALVTKMIILKRASASTMIGSLYHQFMTHDVTIPRAMQLTSDALEAAVENDFVDYDMIRNEFTQRLTLTDEVMQELDMYQYPLPMVVEPLPIQHNRQSGYLSPSTSKSLVVLRGEKADGFYEQADVCVDHLNRVNRIPLKLNMDVVRMIDNDWADLDRQRDGEKKEDYDKRVKAFDRYDAASRDVVHALSQLRDKFWLTHKYDRRGRVYCQGYHVTYQGNAWNKACIEFADAEIVTGS